MRMYIVVLDVWLGHRVRYYSKTYSCQMVEELNDRKVVWLEMFLQCKDNEMRKLESKRR